MRSTRANSPKNWSHFKKPMLFREYVELLYQAYLQDKGYLQTLRDKIKSSAFNQDQMSDPAFENWKDIKPDDSSTYHQSRWKYHPHPMDPQTGVFVFEQQQKVKRQVEIIKDCIKRRRGSNDS
jgi:hypothetical protein